MYYKIIALKDWQDHTSYELQVTFMLREASTLNGSDWFDKKLQICFGVVICINAGKP